MKLILALGNPGEKYATTRHNVGFIYADLLVEKLGGRFKFESKFNAEVAKCAYDADYIWVIKPQTYMNLSGNSLALFMKYYKVDKADVFVVYDDIAMNLGALRFRAEGSDGGHNGVKSIISVLNSRTFDRLKIGIGPQPKFLPSEAFVLQDFSKEELLLLKDIIGKAILATEHYINQGLNSAQAKYNCK